MITKTGSAKWQGGIKDGNGEVSTESGALSSQPYGFATRFEDKAGTNPEELIGAAHASCFAMALSKELGDAGVTDVTIEASSAVSLDQEGEGFAVKKAALTARVSGNGDRDAIEKAAEGAKANCPISKLLNTDITLDLTVA
ncbi:OsmC family peroxiredoxin [Paracoccus sediminicola]|uniref:OsmC family peroxiredoxin n=1 Tax=Paracoccus sediminicola TaxID=3017783 RepID=UPI0022F04B95|nr:OsmC family peroxiredoxin [Paracoccus sediminicola]WBU57460.1 OsmC family peroxiredoxin [Paracoccus sediminicola]